MRKIQIFCQFLVTAGLLLSTPAVLAWGNLGHQTTAEVAQRYLTPEGKRLVQSILGIEPMAAAATFPDLVRSDDRFKEFAPYHYVEVLPGYTYGSKPQDDVVAKDANAIVTKLPIELRKSFAGLLPKLNRSQKMIGLRYLIHVVGDLHQPLHVGNGLDRGANLCDIYYVNPETKNKKPTLLHAFWDDALFQLIEFKWRTDDGGKNATKWFGYREYADLIIKKNPLLAPKLNEEANAELKQIATAPISQWYVEAQALFPVVYPDGATPMRPENRSYCKLVDRKTGKVGNGAYDKNLIPILSEAYIKEASEVAEKQILKGGLRLANMINKMAKGLKPASDKEDKALLNELLTLENETKKSNSL